MLPALLAFEQEIETRIEESLPQIITRFFYDWEHPPTPTYRCPREIALRKYEQSRINAHHAKKKLRYWSDLCQFSSNHGGELDECGQLYAHYSRLLDLAGYAREDFYNARCTCGNCRNKACRSASS